MKSQTGRILKVLMLSKDLYAQGGVSDFVHWLIKHAPQDIEFEHLAIGRSPVRHNRIKNLLTPLVDNFALVRRLRKGRFDCVQINPSFTMKALLRDGMFLITLSLMRYKKTVVFFHGWNKGSEMTIRKNALLRSIFRNIFGRSGRILVLASQFKEMLVEIGFDVEEIYVTTTMFDQSIFEGVSRQRDTCGRTIVFLSRFVREKGTYELLQAFASIANKYPDLKLVLAGDGPECSRMKDWVSTKGLSNRVTFTGYVRGREKAQILVNSDLFVFPTYYGEGCPVALLEAMAAGLVVITAPKGGIPDIFRNGENGVLLDEVSGEAVARAIESVLGDGHYCERVREFNRKQASENYNASVVSRKIASVFRELAGSD